MNRDKQNEIHELAKQMSEAISTEVEQRYIEDEAKLRAVLIENGWRKASDVAKEIFADLDKALGELAMKYSDEGFNEYFGVCEVVFRKVLYPIKKKYLGEDTNVLTNTED